MRRTWRRRNRFAGIKRRFIGQRLRGNLRGECSVVADAHHAVVGDTTDFGAGHVPFFEDLAHHFFVAALGDDEHSLLRFAEQNLVRRHARLAFGNLGQIDLDAGAAAARCFTSGAGQSRRAHVLNAGDGIGREQFQTGFEQQLLLERIADLHGRAIFARFFRQFAGSERGAGQTVAARFSADVKDRIADAAGRAARELLVPQDAKTKNIYERIPFEAFVEVDLAADSRNPDAVAVMRNAGNDAGEQPAVALDLRIADCGLRIDPSSEIR